MITLPRTLTGCMVLAAGLWVLTPAPAADAPELPKDSVKKTAAADLKFLQTRLAELAKKQAAGDKLLEGPIKSVLGVALLLSVYGDALGDTALKTDALKVAETIAKKDFKTAEEQAKKLTVKPGTPGKPGALPKPFKDDVMIAAVMGPSRGSTVGGLNLDRDLKDLTKTEDPTKIDLAAVEILATRSAIITSYAFHHSNEKANENAANKKLWEKLSSESTDLSKQIVEEASKGAKTDEKKLRTLLTNLNTRCNDCHDKFRPDE